MDFDKVPAGKDVPEDIYVAIEIPANADPIKYEIDKDSNAIFVDRFMATPMFYPANYGYIPNTLSEDGDPLDVLVVTPYPVVPGSVIRCRPVGVLNMTDEAGKDAKLVAVDAATGDPCVEFGENGTVDLWQDLGERVPGWYAVTAPPVVVRGVVVTGAQVLMCLGPLSRVTG